MKVRTDSERVRLSRKLVLEFLASSVDLSTAPARPGYLERYDARPERYGPPAPPDPRARPRSAPATTSSPTARRPRPCTQPVKVDNELYVRDYSKCILCYKCVDACGEQYQNTFAIHVAGRGFDARISTEFVVELPESACVYCGNCIAVCPTGALMFRSEHELREAGEWREDEQTVTRDDLPVLRRRLQPRAARPGQHDRQGHEPGRPRRHARQPLHQGPLRLPARAGARLLAGRAAGCWLQPRPCCRARAIEVGLAALAHVASAPTPRPRRSRRASPPVVRSDAEAPVGRDPGRRRPRRRRPSRRWPRSASRASSSGTKSARPTSSHSS